MVPKVFEPLKFYCINKLPFAATRIMSVLGLKCTDTYLEEATLPFSFLPPVSVGVNLYRKEYAPRGAYSFRALDKREYSVIIEG